MHNLHVSRGERENRQPAAVDHDQLEATASTSANESVPWDLTSLEGMDEHLVRAVNALAPEYQVVLTLWAIEEMSYKEIADSVGIPIGTVMSRLHRARQRLSEQLRPFALRERIIRE